MKLLILQLSDIHTKSWEDETAIQPDSIVQAVNSLGHIDECIIVISGDITNGGEVNEFRAAGHLIGSLINKIKDTIISKYISVIVVPGNHDLNFSKLSRNREDIVEAYKSGCIEQLVKTDLSALQNFFSFAARNYCFKDDFMVSHPELKFIDKNINFTLINTAPLSLLGSDNKDKGLHYISEECIKKLKPSKAEYNIVVMHHGLEWFSDPKKIFKNALMDNFTMIFTGHEHDGIGEQKKVNNNKYIITLQGNSLSGDKNVPRGFTAAILDTTNRSVEGFSFLWEKDIYRKNRILNEILPRKSSKFIVTDDFKKFLNYDDNMRDIEQFFVFPSISYIIMKEGEEGLENKEIKDFTAFTKAIEEMDRSIINGDTLSGKTTLAKLLYKFYLYGSDRVPVLLIGDDLYKKRIDKVIEYAFREQYEQADRYFEDFWQLPKEKKILIIDDAGKIESNYLDAIIQYYDQYFDKQILFIEEKLNLNVEKRALDVMSAKVIGEMSIRPFLYDKRKELIEKVYLSSNNSQEASKTKAIVSEMNNVLSSQVRYFRPYPEFIINFVTQYTDRIKLSSVSGQNIFSIVYETSIKNRLIENAKQEEVPLIFNVLAETAFFMHFNNKSWITESELTEIVQNYNSKFRQKIKTSTVLSSGLNSKILLEKNTLIRFRDRNLLSYFVAQSLNKKYSKGTVNNELEHILKYVCFGINSDIVLFMALISNNTRIIDAIIKSAHHHFSDIEEWDIDKDNIPFLTKLDFQVKNSVPDDSEKREKEKQVIDHEASELKVSDIIDVVDDYGYTEDDLNSIDNQLMKSLKFIEILIKILPAFCHDMESKQQDNLVDTIYRYPNKFIYQWLSLYKDDFDAFAEELCEKVSEIRKQKNIASLSIEKVKYGIGQMMLSVIIGLYQMASYSSTKQTTDALEAFPYNHNSNYSIMNLLMTGRNGESIMFVDKASKLFDKTKFKVIKSFVYFSVRDYFLSNDIRIYGRQQALMDKFFGSKEKTESDKKKIKKRIAQNKLRRIQG